MKRLALTLLALSIALGGCTSTAQVGGNIAQTLSTATPEQARTLAEATQAATLATRAVDLYVNTANPNRATLEQLNVLNERVHSTLTNLQAANAAGQSLAIAAFNEAFSAFVAYSNVKGVKTQ